MANFKSFVFNSTTDSQSWVTPAFGKYHLYLDRSGQIKVIDYLGKIVPQSFTGNSSSDLTEVLSGANISVTGPATSRTVSVIDNPSFGGEVNFFGGARFSLAGQIVFEDGLISQSAAQLSTIGLDNYITFTPLSALPSPAEGRMFYSAGTGLFICTGSTNANWKRL